MLPRADKTTPSLGRRDTWEAAQIGVFVAPAAPEVPMEFDASNAGEIPKSKVLKLLMLTVHRIVAVDRDAVSTNTGG